MQGIHVLFFFSQPYRHDDPYQANPGFNQENEKGNDWYFFKMNFISLDRYSILYSQMISY